MCRRCVFYVCKHLGFVVLTGKRYYRDPRDQSILLNCCISSAEIPLGKRFPPVPHPRNNCLLVRGSYLVFTLLSVLSSRYENVPDSHCCGGECSAASWVRVVDACYRRMSHFSCPCDCCADCVCAAGISPRMPAAGSARSCVPNMEEGHDKTTPHRRGRCDPPPPPPERRYVPPGILYSSTAVNDGIDQPCRKFSSKEEA